MTRKLMFPLLFFSISLCAQVDSSKLAFYPLHVGDTWQYRGETNTGGPPAVFKVIGDTIINGKKYFIKANPNYPQNAGFVRVDSLYREAWFQPVADSCNTQGCDCIRDNNFENGFYRLNEPLGSYYIICENKAGALWSNAKPIMKYVSYVEGYVGVGRDAMIFHQEAIDTVTGRISSYGFRFILVKGLGIYREEYEADRFMQLTGAIINGVKWGTIVSVEDDQHFLPTEYTLEQNYPNPFNPRTTIEYSLPRETQVSLKIYNLLGQEVRTLVEAHSQAGHYKVNFDASSLPSGMYIYRLTAGGSILSRKMVLSK